MDTTTGRPRRTWLVQVRLQRVFLGIIAWTVSAASTWALDPGKAQAELADALDPLVAGHHGQVAVLIRHLDSGAECGIRADESMPTASLIKLPIMIAAYQMAADNKLELTKKVTFRDEDRVPGSGLLSRHFSSGLELSLRDCIRLMISHSDNAATNLVLREMGLNATNEWLTKSNCPNTRIHACVFKPETSVSPADSQKWGLGRSTPREIVSLLVQLHAMKIVSPDACRLMLEHLAACDDKDRLGLLLPSGTHIAMKTGSTTNTRSAAGLIDSPGGTFAICVMTAENKDRRWSDDNAAHRLCANIAAAAWKVFNPGRSGSSELVEDGRLRAGRQGELVEDLQRTLNARLSPSPQLTIDGELGPATDQALRAFQKQAGLAVTGVTDAETWKALGPLLPHDNPDPNEEPASETRQPADPLDGPPVLTCRAWIVGDPTTGEILGGGELDTPRDFASTTKIMTAFVALQFAEREPPLLDEIVTISPVADGTPGSSARVRTGESLPLRELLYGLMLPSGNDASIAIAEHLGERCPPLADNPQATPLDRFVAEMNRTAAALEMTNTRYANPHGLTHPDHRSSVRDLFRLASAALKLPLFREIVGTQRHECLVTGPGGYQRTAVWKNTNRLLNHDGFLGVKTGTTTAAGACLVSLSQREGREAVCVVLGATSTDARYVDTRNLFRWYWRSVLTSAQ